MGQIAVGIIGCGNVAISSHIPVLTRSPQCLISALSDSDELKLNRASQLAPQAKLFENYRELLEQRDIDVVFLCVPSHMHADFAIEAMMHGKQVYIEKPIATNMYDLRRVIACQEETVRLVGVGFNYRCNPLIAQLKQLISHNELGDIQYVRTSFRYSADSVPPWKRSRATGGGALLDLGSHHFDLMRFLFNEEIAQVTANISSNAWEQDTAHVQFTMTQGISAQSSFAIGSVDEDIIEVYGSRAKATVNRYLSLCPQVQQRSVAHRRSDALRNATNSVLNSNYAFKKMFAIGKEPSYQMAIESFLNSIRTGHLHSPSLFDGAQSLTAVLAAEESAMSGKIVDLIEFSRRKPVPEEVVPC